MKRMKPNAKAKGETAKVIGMGDETKRMRRRLIWLEELEKGTYDRGSSGKMVEMLRDSIGYVEPERQGRKIVWTTPMLNGGHFTSESPELAEIIAQNEMIIALLLRTVKVGRSKRL